MARHDLHASELDAMRGMFEDHRVESRADAVEEVPAAGSVFVRYKTLPLTVARATGSSVSTSPPGPRMVPFNVETVPRGV
jgi:hypothetical protein